MPMKMKTKTRTTTRTKPRKTIAGRVARLPARRSEVRPASTQVCLGSLVGWDDGGPLVEFEGNTKGPLRARVSGSCPQARPASLEAQPEVVLLVDPRPGRLPVMLGVLRPLGTGAELLDVEARVDGRRVEIDGRDEIVLRCGEASITLRRNGRVLIRGIQVETRATGVNRIKGGSVAIN
jgi:Domain of unknown function (DUF6484)